MTETSPPTSERAQALGTIQALVTRHDIQAREITWPTGATQATMLTKLMVYLGGIFVIAGLSTYTAMEWRHFDSLLRVVITYGPGLIALIAGIIALKHEQKSGMAIAAPLFLIAALYQPAGLFVFLDEYTDGNSRAMGALIVFGAMALQFLMIFLRFRVPSLLLFTLVFAHFAFAALFEIMDIKPRYYTAILGLSGILIAAGLARTRFASITGLGFIFSGFSFTSALYVIFEETPFDILLVAVAGLIIYLSIMIERKTLLFVGVVSMMGYLGYYTNEYFRDVVGWPIALMIMGVLLVVGSGYAIRIGQRFERP